MYKDRLYNQLILSARVLNILNKLNSGDLSPQQYHNKKAHGKRTKNILLVLELSIAWELYKGQYYA